MISLILLVIAVTLYWRTCLQHWMTPDDERSFWFNMVIVLLFLYSILDRRGW